MKSFSKKVDGVRATNLIKLVMNWQNDNKQNELFYSASPICPACNKEYEGHLHFLRCTDPVLRRLNTMAINTILTTMKKLKTAGVIATLLKQIIFSLRDGTMPSPFVGKQNHLGTILQQAWIEQEMIGWQNMLKGRLSKQWRIGQEYFYRSNLDMKIND